MASYCGPVTIVCTISVAASASKSCFAALYWIFLGRLAGISPVSTSNRSNTVTFFGHAWSQCSRGWLTRICPSIHGIENLSSSQSGDVGEGPYMISHTGFHSRGDTKRLMNFREVVEHEMQGHGVGVVLYLL